MFIVNIEPVVKEYLDRARKSSGILFTYSGDNKYATSIDFLQESYFDKFFLWLQSAVIEKTTTADNGSGKFIVVNKVKLYDNLEYAERLAVFNALKISYHDYYNSHITSSSLHFIDDKAKISEELKQLDADRTIQNNPIIFEVNGILVTILITPENILVIELLPSGLGLVIRRERYTITLPKDSSNAFIISYIEKFLLDRNYRIEETKKDVNESSVSFENRDDNS